MRVHGLIRGRNIKETLLGSVSFNTLRRSVHSRNGGNCYSPAYSFGPVCIIHATPENEEQMEFRFRARRQLYEPRAPASSYLLFPFVYARFLFSSSFFYSLFLSIFLSSYLFHQTYVYCGDFIPVLLNRLIIVNCGVLSLCCNWNFNRLENYKIARFFVKKISLKNFILICMCV